jgi:hypothetical protein
VASGKTVKIWREGNRLMQEAPTGTVFEFIPESETTFFTQFIDATFALVGDDNGKATEFIVRESGGDPSTFRRVR